MPDEVSMFRVCSSLSDHELYNSCWLSISDHQPASTEAAVVQLTSWYRQKLETSWGVATWPHAECLHVCQHVQEVSSNPKLSSSLWDFLQHGMRHAASCIRPAGESGTSAGDCRGCGRCGSSSSSQEAVCLPGTHSLCASLQVARQADGDTKEASTTHTPHAAASSRLAAILRYLMQLQGGMASDTGPDAKDVHKLIYQTAVTLLTAAGSGGKAGRTGSNSGLVLRSCQQELSGLLAQWACFCCTVGGDWGQRQLDGLCQDVVTMATTKGEQPSIVMASFEYLVECSCCGTSAAGTTPMPAGMIVCSLLAQGTACSHQQQGTNPAREQLEKSSTVLQMLASVVQQTAQGSAAGSMAAAALLPQLEHHLLSDRPANRKAAIAIAAAAAQIPPAEHSQDTPSTKAAAMASMHAAALLLAAAADRDAGVRVKALGHLHDVSVRSHEAVAQQALAAATSSLSDKSKLVRLKAMQLLTTLYCHLPGSAAKAARWQQVLADAAGAVIRNLAGLLEARPDTLVCCPDAQSAALELLQVLPARLQAIHVMQLLWGTELPLALAGQLLGHLHKSTSPQQVLQLWLHFLPSQGDTSMAKLLFLQPAVAKAAAGYSCGVRQECIQRLCRVLASEDPCASAPEAAAVVQVLLLYGGLSSVSLEDAAGEAAVLLDVVPLLVLSSPPAVDAALELLHRAVVAVQAAAAAATDESDGAGQQRPRQLTCLVLQGMTRLLPSIGLSTDHTDKALQVVCACCCTMPAAAMQLLVNLQAAVASASSSQAPAAEANEEQRTAVRFILILKHMTAMYAYEHKRFLEQLQMAGAAAAAGCAPASSKAGTDGQQQKDYMVNEQLRRQHEEAAQAYLDDLMSSSAPACYLPLLLQLVSTPAVALPFRVLALEAVTAIATLTSRLTQAHHPVVAELLQRPSTPGPLLLAAIKASHAMVHAWPAHAAPLVPLLEQRLLLCCSAANQQQQQAHASLGKGAAAAVQPPGNEHHQDGSIMLALAGAYAELLHGDKLPWAAPNCAVVSHVLVAAGCGSRKQGSSVAAPATPAGASCGGVCSAQVEGRHAAGIMQQLLLGVLCSPGHHNRRTALLLSLFSSCPPWGRRQLVQELLLPLLTPSELAAPQLVLPVLRSVLVVDAAATGAAAGAAALLGCMTPSAEAMELLSCHLQAHPEAAVCYTADVRDGLRAFVGNLPARLLSGSPEEAADGADDSGGPMTAAPAAGRKKQNTSGKPGGKARTGAAAAVRQAQGLVLQLLKAPGVSAGQQHGKRRRAAEAVAGGKRGVNGSVLVGPAPAAAASSAGDAHTGPGHAGRGQWHLAGSTSSCLAEQEDVHAYEQELAAFLKL